MPNYDDAIKAINTKYKDSMEALTAKVHYVDQEIIRILKTKIITADKIAKLEKDLEKLKKKSNIDKTVKELCDKAFNTKKSIEKHYHEMRLRSQWLDNMLDIAKKEKKLEDKNKPSTKGDKDKVELLSEVASDPLGIAEYLDANMLVEATSSDGKKETGVHPTKIAAVLNQVSDTTVTRKDLEEYEIIFNEGIRVIEKDGTGWKSKRYNPQKHKQGVKTIMLLKPSVIKSIKDK